MIYKRDGEKMITVEHLEKNYGEVKVLSDVSLNIEDGTVYGIIGHSGAGKSTLLRCLNGLEKFSSGSVQVLGRKIEELDTAKINSLRKEVSMIFQNFNLLSRKNVYENVALPLVFAGKKEKSPEVRERVTKMLELVGLSDKTYKRPSELSGGQKQRVAIARALILEPKVLLCDEATSALDPMTTREILDLLKHINKELGITIIVVTHQMDVVKQICERVAFLKDGKMVAEGRPEDIFINPDKNVKAFLGENLDMLPSGGINMHIFFDNETADKPVIAMMAKELGVEASIIWARLDDFRGTVLGSLTVQIKEEEKDKVFAFLKEQGVKWEVI